MFFLDFLKRIFWKDHKGATVLNSVDNRRHMMSDIQLLLNKNSASIIFDVGANIGNFTEDFLNTFPAAHIYCFEPSPETFSKLEKRFNDNPRIHLNNFALSDMEGISEFYCYKEDPTNSFFSPARQWREWIDGKRDALEINQKIFVPTKTLDAFCASTSISKIDILKIDTQGAECLVLNGAEKFLSIHAIKIIIAEITFVPVYKQQPFFYEICKKLANHGYFLVNLYNIKYDETKHFQIKWGDGLFFAKSDTKKEYK